MEIVVSDNLGWFGSAPRINGAIRIRRGQISYSLSLRRQTHPDGIRNTIQLRLPLDFASTSTDTRVECFAYNRVLARIIVAPDTIVSRAISPFINVTT